MSEELELPESEEEEYQGPASLDDDEALQREVLGKIRTHNQKGKSNRMAEVQNARDGRLYFRNIQQFYWNEDRQDISYTDSDDEPYSRTFNIHQPYGKIFCSTFMGARPKVRAEADDPFDSSSIKNTAKAQTYERVYRKFNDTPTQQLRTSMLLWTDGRFISRTLDRGGREITEFWGVLESRIPATAKEDIETPLKNCALIELEDEYPLVQLKKEYGDKKDAQGESIRKKLNSGLGDEYERNARIAAKRQAGTDTTFDVMSGEDSYGLGTKTWSYLRPEFYEEFQEASRNTLNEKFPAGLCVVHSGDLYLESYECDPDSCLDVVCALPGDGMSRPSIGATTMTLQDSANTTQNLIEETFDHGIPTTYYDMKTDIDGLNTQREMPGASRKAQGLTGQPLSAAFYTTAQVVPSEFHFNYLESVRGSQAQFASGQQAAIYGGSIPGDTTATEYTQARNMALGQMAIVWKPYTAWFAREMTRAVKMAGMRTDDIKTTLPPQRQGGSAQAVRIAPSDLAGLSFTNDSDENFPETWTEKSAKFMNLVQMGGDIADWVLDEEPDNLYIAKKYIGLEDLVIPGEDVRNNVLADIASMEHMPSFPDPNQMPQTMLPAMGQPPAPPQFVSPIQIDSEFLEDKDYETGWKTAKHWIFSAAGQDAKTGNPTWFQNVRLYALQYKQGVDAAQQKAAQANTPPPPPQKPLMALTANFKDLPPDAQVQALAIDGIQANPSTISANKEVPKQPGSPAGA